MKHKLSLLILILCSLFLIPNGAEANDFLEQQDHYTVMAINGRIHMKFPVFSRGGKNYYVESNSGKSRVTVLWYALESNPNTHIPVFSYSGEDTSSGPSGNDDKAYGKAYVKLYDTPGTVVVTNVYTGSENEIVPNDSQSHTYEVVKKKEAENDNDRVVWLEIDWYPPSHLDHVSFNIGTKVYVNSVSAIGFKYDFDWTLKEKTTGINNLIDPQLFDPYFYATKDDHLAGYGYAAVPYSLFYEPIEYRTSFNNVAVPTTERANNLYVPTTDTLQTGFNATFKIYVDKANNVTREQKTQSVTIPAYHHIYDLTATEETDTTGTFTGRNIIQWAVRNPQVADLVENDYFEVQRAMNADFSDAQTISMERMETGANYTIYSVPDNSRDTWNGNADTQTDTINQHFSVEKNNYELFDANGNPLAILRLKLTADRMSMPGVPVYYRVRRASSSVWGWEHDYAQSVHMTKHNFLAPLAETQTPYTLDPEFSKNNQVHFAVRLDNKQISYTTPAINECSLSLEEVQEDLRDSLDLHFSVNTENLHQAVIAMVYDKEDNIVKNEWWIRRSQSIKVPAEGKLMIFCVRNNRRSPETQIYALDNNAEVRIEEYPYQDGYEVSYEIKKLEFKLLPNHIGQEIAERISALESTIKQEMLVLLDSATRDPNWGHSMWDKTARLVLVRSSKENPSAKSEFIIPQDSIKRQADGSWLATYTDIADKACTHYTYAVRIDQSDCDLHVVDSTQLLPMPLTGPSLYFDEAATINSFVASQGATDSNLKRGVMINWIPSSNAVDEYVLVRKPVGSTDSPDTVYTGLDVTYFDLSATPGTHYEYTVIARYECNGKYSENSASTEGWRTPYGEISGVISMPDNSGMAGVKVDLQGPDKTVIKSLITGADGTFLFDSLTYALSGTQYVVVPTHTHAVFSYNYSDARSAGITMSADNAVASGLQFINSSTVRLSGRALFSTSSVPVAEAMFTLNGDTILRNGLPLKTGTDGKFELTLTQSQPYILRIFKPGHVFEGDGILHVEQGKDTFALSEALDGVRFYDQTKVRLVGRVAGGINQRDLPEAFGLGTNNLGDNLQLVLQVEGDNTAWLVLDPNDMSRDTLMETFDHVVYNTDPLAAVKERTVGSTSMLTERKRIIIRPDSATGEYQVDLFPIKYKVIQATATGYASLFASGQSSETFDLTNAPLVSYNPKRGNDSVHYNAVYDRIYRSPVQLAFTQYLFGMKQKGLGEAEMDVSSFSATNQENVKLYTQQPDSTIAYLLGYPLFYNNRKYQFGISAYEDYYYNNSPSRKRDRVPQRGGRVTIHNGLLNTRNEMTFELDSLGKNTNVWLDVDNLDTEIGGTGALRTVSALLNVEGNAVETNSFQAFIVGNKVNEKELTSAEADINILDIIRDPGGNGSSAWVESGTSYTFSYTESYDLKAGTEFNISYGGTVSRDIGVFTGTGAGNYTGSTFSTGKTLSGTIPLVAAYSWGFKYTYTLSTTDRISTATKKNKSSIGGNADVFLGTTTSILSGKAKSVAIINDDLFAARRRAVEAGTMLVLAEGTDSLGHGYHLVTGEKVVLGSTISNTFAYSQEYIYNTVIPKLVLERYNLLMTFPDSAAAQAAADAANDVVYWYIDSTTAVSLQDTLLANSYKMIIPKKATGTYPDRVGALENMIKSWIGVLYYNEKEKVKARECGKRIGTYSVNYGNTYTHSDSYSYTANCNWLPVGSAFANGGANLTKGLSGFLGSLFNNKGHSFGEVLNIKDKLDGFINRGKEWKEDQYEKAFKTLTPESKWDLKLNPVISFTPTTRNSNDVTNKKSTGFTLVADDQGDITVSVYRAPLDSVWKADSKDVREKVDLDSNDDYLYGSYVFFTEAGATYCMHEKEEKTLFYNPGTVLSNPTMMIAKPELSINTYEMSGVPADQRAQFRIEIRNAGQRQYGLAGSGTIFELSLTGASNPDGAKVYLAGAPLIQPVSYFLEPGQAVSQIVEVERGLVDDYNNLQLFFSVADCPKTNTSLSFSVHFMPESSPVSIDMPRQNWVMNTLSPQDSAGYYLPINIGGFNVHHKNFDHIEFQYKLSTQSDEMWVNQCSFYADDSLYNLATGNKARIENGRITPFRFYGERDPMEQQYDLRAVSFCRYGSGFVTKASPVISGTKDTRPPRVFGEPEPANAILGVGDHLLLRFNEAIAGNYLDEDNNFQLLGVTNQTGVTAGTALHFDMGATAVTKVKRDLTNKSFTLDMMLRPSDANRSDDQVLFMFGNDDAIRMFILTADNRLQVMTTAGSAVLVSSSKPIGPMLDFTRVLFEYDKDLQQYRFYAGTTDLTDALLGQSDAAVPTGSAELRFGGNYKGDMLEVRLWTKALTPEEIAATADHYLTGYEQELLAYYRMNEGKGEAVTDRAHGATLYLKGCSWNQHKGYSVHLAKTDRLQLNGNLFARSKVYDATHMFWFKTAVVSSERANLFAAGRTDDKHGALIALENGRIVLCSDSLSWTGTTNYADNSWHHVVLSVNRTYNNAALYVDGSLIQTFPATMATSTEGAMYLGGNFDGYMDEFAVFEQALPKTLIEAYDNISLAGDEMGLIAYLPFEEQYTNPNGILEQRFSVNDRRQYRDPQTGAVIDKVVPLINEQTVNDQMVSELNAPVSSHGLLTKLNFDWSFNDDELMINLNMQDREINKQSVYVTVRDVEDLNGNPMASPVSWIAFVDHNTLKWEDDDLDIYYEYGTKSYGNDYVDFQIINNSGKRRQYKIESLPDWLTVDKPSGSLNPLEDQTICFHYNTEMPVGDYLDIVYLTDEDGLSEPLEVEYHVTAWPPYEDIDEGLYPLNMSVCGQVKIGTAYSNDPNDIVYALYRNTCVGQAKVTVNNLSNTADVYLTIHGNEQTAGRTIDFVLWQASTGKIFHLTPSKTILFAHGYVYGCGDEKPVLFTTSGSQMQEIALAAGWTWISTNLDLRPETAKINTVISAAEPWKEGDLIKNPDSCQFCTYSQVKNQFVGKLKSLDYTQMYMVYSAADNTLRLNGEKLAEKDKQLTLRGDGQWNAFPCLLDEATEINEAMSSYYDQASAGDIVKAHNRFAIFSTDKRWVGDLTALRPGEGYLMRRMGQNSVTINFHNHVSAAAPQCTPAFHSNAASNMTMICKMEELTANSQRLMAYVGEELVGEATKIDSLYFLTISSDLAGELRFETEDGQELTANSQEPIAYMADSHHGTLKAPIILRKEDNRPYKIIENNHVIIIRNNEKYDITGKKL